EAGYMDNASQRGEQLKQGLRQFQRRHAAVGDVRGLGLMVAMDLVKSREPYVGDPALRDEVVQTAFRHGLLLLGCGESAIRFCPPLCVSAQQVDTALVVLGQVLDGILQARRPEALATA